MATFSVVAVPSLDKGYVLAPERYDPRRRGTQVPGRPLSDLVEIVADLVDSKKASDSVRYLVLDTGDAEEGVIRARKGAVPPTGIGSNKKRIRPGDVIISRLRPYLRQVAFVDQQLFDKVVGRVEVLVSTEFYVLRSRTRESLGFLVPFLLTESIQRALSAAQEGGHHPRFNQAMLESLVIPENVLAQRDSISHAVEAAVTSTRLADLELRAIVRRLNEEPDAESSDHEVSHMPAIDRLSRSARGSSVGMVPAETGHVNSPEA